MTFDPTINVDAITIDQADALDAAWVNAGMPDNGLRIYGLRRSGNRTYTFLGVPGTNGTYPTYILSAGRYLHMAGPTLDEWYAEQDYRDLRDTEASARW